MVLKCLIVDDELMARKSIERLCSKFDSLEVVQVCENGQEALTALKNHTIDLIFLDVEMPQLSGIDLVREAMNLPQVIFTTSKTEYAFEAFEYNITDYLKKPVTMPRFKQAIEKALENFQQNLTYHTDAKEVYIREDGKLIRILFDDILFFENVGDYIRVKTTNSSHIIHGTLKGIEAKLTHPRFLKVHRSYIINLDKIKDIEENTLVIEQKVIPISRVNKPILMTKLNLL